MSQAHSGYFDDVVRQLKRNEVTQVHLGHETLFFQLTPTGMISIARTIEVQCIAEQEDCYIAVTTHPRSVHRAVRAILAFAI